MSVLIDEDRTSSPRPGLAGGFAEGPPGAGDPVEIWRRLWFTLGALIVYRIGSYLPIPGLDLIAVDEFRHIAFLTGGVWIPDLSIFSLGIMPYISAVVLVELVKHFVPRLGGLAMAGPEGRRKLNQYARILTVALAAFQAVGVALGLEELPEIVTVPRLLFEAMTVLTLVAGAICVMWLADQITVRGLGNGALVILVCGIVSQLPLALAKLVESVKIGDLDVRWLPGVLLMTAAVVPLVVLVERATRWITIYDPHGEIGVRAADGRYAHIALKLNPTQVWAPIAVGILATALSGIIASDSSSGYLLLYGLLIALFALFFGLATFDPEQMASKLKDSGGFVPGYRPGENTARHLRTIQTALAIIGAAYLVAACVLPDVIYIYRWADMWAPFVGYQLFLLAWLMVRILDQIRPYVRPLSTEGARRGAPSARASPNPCSPRRRRRCRRLAGRPGVRRPGRSAARRISSSNARPG